ncbi:unnamed protein product, partial [Mesorhabditis spiculigera]
MIGCPNHPGVALIEDARAGDIICPECGLVVSERAIDVSTEWRSFSNDHKGGDPSRVGAPENPIMNGSDLHTCIAVNAFSSEADQRLYTNQRRSASNADRQLVQVTQILREMCARVHLPTSIELTAASTFKRVYDTGSLRAKNVEAQAAACLYIACRREQVPRTFKEICAISNVSKKVIGRLFKQIIALTESSLTHINATDFMSRFCANLGLSAKVENVAIHVAQEANQNDYVPGRSPVSVAAAAIFLASQMSAEKVNTKQVHEVTGVAECTIRQTYKLMLPHATLLLPVGYEPDTPIYQLPTC